MPDGTSVEPPGRAPVTGRTVVRRVLVAVAVAVVLGVAAWVLFGVGIDAIVTKIQDLPPVLVVLLVFLLPALEASIFIGLAVPGEIAVLVGGVSASNGHVPLAAVLIAACLGAVIGDQVGYVVGREWGVQILGRVPDRLIDVDRIAATQTFIRRMGAKGVVLGRWTAALRALVPGLAGLSHMPYGRFLAANAFGGIVWATVCVLLGYAAGNNIKTVESALGNVSSVLLGLVVLGLVVRYIVRRRRESRPGPE